jgi:NDP-sugar pyrophosphorylase family protein
MKSLNKPLLVIPSGGEGIRFAKAGFVLPKPLNTVKGKRMIAHVTDSFPHAMDKIIVLPESLKRFEKDFADSGIAEKDITYIASHKLGPAYTLNLIAERIPDGRSCYISYNDIAWTWNYSLVQEIILQSDCDAAVFTYEGFHPHLIGNSFSAFCRKEENILKEIREKEPFTDVWMNEPLSAGLFYCADTALMKKYTAELILSGKKIAGEFFPSLIFNYYVRDGYKVITIPLEWFVHWGNPEQFMDYIHWEKIFTSCTPPHDIPALMMLGGSGERMKGVGQQNKAFLPAGNDMMYRTVLKGNGVKNYLLAVPDENMDAALKEDVSRIFPTGRQQPSQALSLEKCAEFLTKKDHFLLLSNDCYAIFDPEKLMIAGKNAPVLFGFRPSLTQEKLAQHHSFFTAEDGVKVKAIHYKKRTSESDLGLAGMFYFHSGSVFQQYKRFLADTNGDSADHFLIWLLSNGTKINYIEVDAYIHPGTEDEYREFHFWFNHFRK